MSVLTIPSGILIAALFTGISLLIFLLMNRLIKEKTRLCDEKFNSFIEQSTNGFILADSVGKIVEFNRAMEDITGIKRSEAAGKFLWDVELDILDPISEFNDNIIDQLEELQEDIGSIFLVKQIINNLKSSEIKIKNKNHQKLYALRTIFTIETEKQFFIASAFTDITERKDNEERLRTLFDSSPFGAHGYLLNGKGELIFSAYNKSAEDIVGIDHSGFLGKCITEIFPNLEGLGLTDIYAKLARGEMKNYEGIIRYEDKGIHGVYEIFAFNTGTNKMSVLFIDKTEKKRSEEALQIEKQNFIRVFENSPVPMQIIDRENPGIILTSNIAFKNLFGSSPGDAVDASIIPTINDNQRAGADFLENFPIMYRDTNGITKNLHLTTRPIIFNNRNCCLFVFLDVTEIVNTKHELEAAFNYIQFIVDSIKSVIIAVDQELNVTHYNKAALYFAENSSNAGLLFEKFPKLRFIESSLSEFTRNSINQENLSKIIVNQNGELQHYQFSISKIKDEKKVGYVILLDDITERKKIDELMIQTEKMMSVAGLAAGMAHEINNPLGTIVQGCQNILRRTSDAVPKNNEVAQQLGINISVIEAYMKERQVYDIIESMRKATGRASEIIKNMLQFSRRSESKKVKYDIAKLLEETIDLAYNDYDLKKKFDIRNIEIIKEFPPSLPKVKVTVTEIQQVIFNIIQNAAQAMTEEKSADKKPRIIFRLIQEINHIVIEIEDNGPGIPDAIGGRIFEPFFTTKEVGKGTGLGLSVSYMIIKNNHGGQLTFTSKAGKGTTFIIKLPS